MTSEAPFEELTAAARPVRRWSPAVAALAASLLLGCGGGGHGTMMAQSPDGGAGAGVPAGAGGAAGGHGDAGTDAMLSDAGATGNDAPVKISVTVDHCPTVLAAASPSVTTVDKPVSVDATGDDADGDPITYVWSAPAGTFGMPTAASTTYTCAKAGDVMLTVTVSDQKCEGQTAVPFTCLPTQ